MDETEFVTAMKEAMERLGVSQGRIAREAGFTSQSAVSNILHGKRRIRIDERAAIERLLEMRPESRVQWVPVIGLASAGLWQEAIQTPMGDRPISSRSAGRRAFGVEIKGDSMDRLLPEGGWAIVDPDQTSLYAGRVYLIENEHHETTVKRYLGDPARFEPVSTNPAHKLLELDQTPFRVIGRVVAYGFDEGL
jgi:SOS-response transcriptional repressor LexA